MDIETLPGKKIDVNDVSSVSLRDIYMRLCACRDFEIKLQWERAVFLTAFLIACYAGYGSYLLAVHQHGVGHFPPLIANGIPLAITFIGLVLSMFWVLMAKGSKAWYEHYEQAIAVFAKNKNAASANVTHEMISHEWSKMFGIKRDSMSNWIFRLNGGAYSVSKIVIAIGVCSFLNWALLFLLHLGVALYGTVCGWKICEWLMWIKEYRMVTYVVIAMVAVVIVPYWMCRWLGSEYLKGVKELSEN